MRKIIAFVKSIQSAFDNLMDFIHSIFMFFSSLLQQLLLLFRYIVKAVDISTDFILTFPPWLGVFATITVSLSVLYLVIARRGGNN